MRYRYLLCIVPPDEVADRIRILQQALVPTTGRFQGLNAPVHITLFLVDMPDEHEAELIALLEQGLAHASAFQLHVHGITHFPDQRTIYADPQEKEAVLKLVTAAAAPVLAHANIADFGVKLADHPHMTIAAGLKPAQFATGWQALHNATFSVVFKVAQVVLMKRELSPTGTYGAMRRFALEGDGNDGGAIA